MKNNLYILVIASLILGFTLGYITRGDSTTLVTSDIPQGTHLMPDGTMMANGGSMDMADMMTAMNAELKGKTGDNFDMAFLQEMIVHHEGAVEMAKLALTNAKHQEIRDLAEAIISAQNTEISQMKSWMNSWYNISN